MQFQQTAAVFEGTVVDAVTGQPVAGARIGMAAGITVPPPSATRPEQPPLEKTAVYHSLWAGGDGKFTYAASRRATTGFMSGTVLARSRISIANSYCGLAFTPRQSASIRDPESRQA
jgi:hypothetical protein